MRDVSKVKVRTTGAIMLAVIVGMFGLTAAFYNQVFRASMDITVQTERAGLIMDPGNKVKYRGVEVGRVNDVTKTHSGALLELALDTDLSNQVASNVRAEIRASTIFGAKYVELVDAITPSSTRLQAGETIDARSVTTEVNTLFEGLDDVLSTVDVLALNNTLSVLSNSLRGRGDAIAELAATADAYLTELEPSLPQLRTDLRDLARLSSLGVRVAPALLQILENATTTSRTISSEQQALDRLLVDVAVLGETGSTVLSANTEQLVNVLAQTRPTSRLLAEYASELPCFLRGLERSGLLALKGAGGSSPGLNILATLRTQIRPYAGPADLPTPLRGSGPSCGGLPYLGAGDLPAPDIGGN